MGRGLCCPYKRVEAFKAFVIKPDLWWREALVPKLRNHKGLAVFRTRTEAGLGGQAKQARRASEERGGTCVAPASDLPGAAAMWRAFTAIQGYLRYVAFERDEVLVPPGPSSERDHLLLLTEGLVEVNYRASTSSEPELLAVVEPGQLVGELGLFNGEDRLGFCVAATRGCGLALERDNFRHLLDERPELACHFLLTVMPQPTCTCAMPTVG